MTLQREVDGSRSALKSQERFSDDLRRQAVAAREEAATYKAENLRLTDELRSCKARLNSALDTQEELLRKNSSMHEKLLDLQNRESKLRDDISSRDSLVEYYKTHNEKIENQLREVIDGGDRWRKREKREKHGVTGSQRHLCSITPPLSLPVSSSLLLLLLLCCSNLLKTLFFLSNGR